MNSKSYFVGILGLATLVSCGSAKDEVTISSTLFELGKSYVEKINPSDGTEAGQQAQADLAAAQKWLENYDKPLSFALIENTKGNGFLGIEEVNAPYETWRSSIDSVIVQKNGFITATFSFGDDLVAAKVPSTVRNTGTKQRINYYLVDDENIVGSEFSCTWSSLGSEDTPVFGKSYKTEHFREKCSNSESKFSNDYWVDSRGIVRQSRQFVSKTVGYVSLQRIIE
ncbi:YjbF family lipoprotein [Halocynthiibacter sp. C4]|uniref:YjbF family lipoprotein n=1 Tax=Halocynthiibacter sp. C4 TaxID=2992758 RepID=UPI00237BE2E9|nr:YjbF family lipoprotein [Halocynthiibacter sp. C4]MDE0588358.1 YjbF family lipoprotein [Halocynthiibacter sp. C4]